ncbi:MAG: ATP-binding protein [Actinomycetota bacterium]|nr:ATP-binding protein [Actinomycetota bacterium]
MRVRSITQRDLTVASISAAAAGLLAVLFGLPVYAVAAANLLAIGAGIAAWITSSEDEQSTLIAEVSHELRTPLTGILGTLELLTESTIPIEASEADELLIAAHGEANHLLHIVGNLHARSRLDRSILQPDAEATNLRTTIERAMARSPRVARRCYLSPGDQAVAIGDAQLIMQIVTNLIQNIERYAPDGECRVTFDRRGDQMTAAFSDQGPGVPAVRADRVFDNAASTQGLGLGLGLSRQLARAMGGDLTLDDPGTNGATFTLHLPASDEDIPAVTAHEIVPGDRSQAHSPRSRLLVDMAEALSEQSLDRVVGGIQKIYSELLGATGGMLWVPRKDGSFHAAGTHGDSEEVAAGTSAELENVMTGIGSVRFEDIHSIPWLSEVTLGGNAAMLLPVHDTGRVVAVLAVGWKADDAMPTGPAVDVAEALADLTASAIARTALARDVVFERTLRASVMDELPIAVSIFVGDPPQVIDWNRKERELLGIDDDSLRPHDLDASQHQFDVRFADGTPLTVENAPVTSAVRTAKAAGPFILLVRRADGSQIHTRTYCAPFFDDDGAVAGAVVTSESLDMAVSPFGDPASRA